MEEKARRELENQLVVMGMARLNDPELIQQFAVIINTYGGHDFFEGLLGECEPAKRTEMYEALRPHLNFNPWPLDTYIEHIKARASMFASREKPIEMEGQKYMHAEPEDATGCIATLTCCKCTKQANFYGKTPADAAIAARSAGWIRDLARQKEICPQCPAPFGQTMHRTN
jgi:hypothetical protein